MKRIILGIAIVAALTGCTFEERAEQRDFRILPPELQNCKFFYIQNSSGTDAFIARCPNSTTSATYKSGKTTVTTVTIDGVEYEQKNKIPAQ